MAAIDNTSVESKLNASSIMARTLYHECKHRLTVECAQQWWHDDNGREVGCCWSKRDHSCVTSVGPEIRDVTVPTTLQMLCLLFFYALHLIRYHLSQVSDFGEPSLKLNWLLNTCRYTFSETGFLSLSEHQSLTIAPQNLTYSLHEAGGGNHLWNRFQPGTELQSILGTPVG